METTLPQPTSTRRERWAWYLYDFGNSAYAAVVLLAIYATYFQGTVVGGAEGSRLWGIALGIAMLFVAITAPILGTLADFSGSKKKFLFFYTAMCVIFCGLLFLVQPGMVVLGMVFFILAEIGYRSAQVFYNSLLPEIASQDEMARVSGDGWAVGSVGGILCLIAVLAAIRLLGDNVLPTGLIVRLALIFTALFYSVSSISIFVNLKERAKPQALPDGYNYITLAFQRLSKTFGEVKSFREFIKFIISFLIFNDGILMALDYAAILGAVLFGMSQEQLLLFMIIVQLASVAGAYLFGLWASDFGEKLSLVVALLLMFAVVIWMFFNNTLLGFFFIGGVAGFALTGVQSVSRTMVGSFSPPGKSAEFYGFFAVAGRTSSFIGPTVFGLLVGWLANKFAEQGENAQFLWFQVLDTGATAAVQHGHRLAVLSIAVFLLIGFVMLLFVNDKKGREAALAAAGEPTTEETPAE